MNQVVFLELNQPDAAPFTTSKVIAECAGMNHRRVKDAIRKYQSQLLSFGLLGAYAPKSSGGRPEEIIKLNEEQATFLITLLKNTPPVVTFKKELVRQFCAMRTELQKQQIEREMLEPIRRALTEALSRVSATKSAPVESRRSSERQRQKNNSTDDETLLKLVAELVSATETHSWKGTATELADALKISETPNRLTRKLNVLKGRLLEEYHIYYETGRTYKERSVILVYAPPKLEIKTLLEAVEMDKIRKNR